MRCRGEVGVGQTVAGELIPMATQDQAFVMASILEGAARDVVGIRCGAISGNMKVSFQAARSIG
jgi:hypothetical protein